MAKVSAGNILALIDLVSGFFGDKRRRQLKNVLRTVEELADAHDSAREAGALVDEAAATEGAVLALCLPISPAPGAPPGATSSYKITKIVEHDQVVALDLGIDKVEALAALVRSKTGG